MVKNLRSMALMVVLAMVVTVFPITGVGAVADTEISGIAKPGFTLTGTTSGSDETYAWVTCNQDGSNESVAFATTAKYTLLNADAGKYIKFKVTSGGVTATSQVFGPIAQPLRQYAEGSSGLTEKAPEQYRFKLASETSKEFILLDTNVDMEHGNPDSKFFVMSYNSYGTRRFYNSSSAPVQYLSLTDTLSIAHFLNNDFLTSGNGTGNILPAEIRANIDKNHTWLTETGAINGLYNSTSNGVMNDYTITCGVNILSTNEFMTPKYSERLGWKNGSGDYIWTRSPLRTAAWRIIGFKANANFTVGNRDDNWNILPAFWLKSDFFTKVKMDTTSWTGESTAPTAYGSEVRKYLFENYSAAQLKDIYGPGELLQIGFEPEQATVSVKNVGAEGILKPGFALKGTYDYDPADNGGKAESGSLYQWYRADSENGTYTAIDGATSKTYTLLNADAGKFFKFEVTPGNINGLGDSTKAETGYGPVAPPQTQYTEGPNGLGEKAPEQYRFKLASETSKEFILLDTNIDMEHGNPDSKFFVMSYNSYGTRKFYNSSTAQIQSLLLNDPLSIAHFLNNDFLTTGNGAGNILPAEIKAKIDYNHTWLTETGAVSGLNGSTSNGVVNDYTITCGINLLSANEFMTPKYSERLGWKNGSTDYIWTRSPLRTAAWRIIGFKANAEFALGNRDDSWNILPTFWLKDDFFTTVKLDTSGWTGVTTSSTSHGDEVRKYLFENYSPGELKGIYSPGELLQIGFEAEQAAVVVKNVRAEGILKPGYTIRGAYDYDPAENDGKAESGSLYQWYRADSEYGTYTAIAGATLKTYTLNNADADKFFKFEVIAGNANGLGDPAKAEMGYGPVAKPLPQQVTGLTGLSAQAPAEYRFALKSNPAKEFILLDTETDLEHGNANSQFFVMAYNNYGRHRVALSGDIQYIDPTVSGNMGHFLNNEFKTNGNNESGASTPINYAPLSEEILNKIDNTHIWLTETGAVAGLYGSEKNGVTNDYTVTCGINLLSANEMMDARYKTKIGWRNDLPENSTIWTRSPLRTGAWRLLGFKGNSEFTICNRDDFGSIFPAFWLKSDFFTSVTLNVETMGSAIKDYITGNYQKSDLRAIYSDAELKVIWSEADIYGKIIVTDQNNVAVDDLVSTQTKLTISSNIVRVSEGSEEVALFVAVYGEGGRLESCHKDSYRFEEGTSKTLTVTLDGLTPEFITATNRRIKAFLWSTEGGNMTPVADYKILRVPFTVGGIVLPDPLEKKITR